MNDDGKIIIGTVVDDKEFYKKIKELDNTKVEDFKISPELDTKQLYNEILKAGKELDKFKIKDVLTEDELIEIQTYISFIDKANERLQELGSQKLYPKGLKEVEQSLEEIKNKTIHLDIKSVEKELNNVGKSIEKNIKKVMRWGLSILGIRGAYSAIRRIISMVSAQNEEVANKMQQMKSVLASAFIPIVQQIVNWLAKAMVYINYLFNALTGKDLFNFADATKQGAKNLDNAVGSAKELHKQLAGFDEMNILSEPSGGGGGAVASDFENIFDKLKGMQMPKWIETLADILKKIKKYWKELITVVVAFGTAIKAIQIAQFVSKLLGLEGISPRIATSIGLITSGIVLLAGSIINLILNWDTMTAQEKKITVALAGIGGAFITLGYAVATGISIATLGIGALIAIVVGLVATLGTLAWKHDQVAKSAMDERIQTELLEEAKKKVKEAYDALIDAIDRQTQAEKNLIEVQDKTGESGEALWESVQNGTKTYQEMTEQQRETYKAYKELIEANEAVNDATKTYTETQKAQITQDYNDRISKAKTRDEYDKLKKEIIDSAEKGEISWEQASDSISRMMHDMNDEQRKIFTEDIPKNIKDGLEPNKYSTTFETFKRGWNRMIDGLSKAIEVTANLVTNKNGGGSGTGFAKGGIVVPRLASGGIINQPGRGVPISSAIGGERGMEGVIPLTDSQQMALLGEAIGRYITINALITNTMNGRVISRELQKVQNENDFASNR